MILARILHRFEGVLAAERFPRAADPSPTADKTV